MRALSIFLAVTALLTTVGTAQAADAGSTGLRQASFHQMARAKGSYELDDGRRAQLFVQDNRLYVRIGRSGQTELLLDGPDRYASRDGKIVVRFDSETDNRHIVLEHTPDVGSLDAIRLAANDRPGKGGAD
jgi:hypothetical protein